MGLLSLQQISYTSVQRGQHIQPDPVTGVGKKGGRI